MILRICLSLYHNSLCLDSAVIELGKNWIESYLQFRVGQRYMLSYRKSKMEEHEK